MLVPGFVLTGPPKLTDGELVKLGAFGGDIDQIDFEWPSQFDVDMTFPKDKIPSLAKIEHWNTGTKVGVLSAMKITLSNGIQSPVIALNGNPQNQHIFEKINPELQIMEIRCRFHNDVQLRGIEFVDNKGELVMQYDKVVATSVSPAKGWEGDPWKSEKMQDGDKIVGIYGKSNCSIGFIVWRPTKQPDIS